jgi:hypothetical protein
VLDDAWRLALADAPLLLALSARSAYPPQPPSSCC